MEIQGKKPSANLDVLTFSAHALGFLKLEIHNTFIAIFGIPEFQTDKRDRITDTKKKQS